MNRALTVFTSIRPFREKARRHDELEDLVATVGLHKAVACLRGALGTVVGDEVPPLVARDGTNSCAGAMRADDREFFGSMLSG